MKNNFDLQTHISFDINHIFKDLFHNEWSFDKTEYDIRDYTIYITYRIFNSYKTSEPLTIGFHRWTRNLVKELVREVGNSKKHWVYDRQPVGMYAMDYAGSRNGLKSDSRIGAHVHAIMVVHPELKQLIERLLAESKKHADEEAASSASVDNAASQSSALKLLASGRISEDYAGTFFWQNFRKDKTIQETIHYNLKGIMKNRDFYEGRKDQYGFFGPNRLK